MAARLVRNSFYVGRKLYAAFDGRNFILKTPHGCPIVCLTEKEVYEQTEHWFPCTTPEIREVEIRHFGDVHVPDKPEIVPKNWDEEEPTCVRSSSC